MEKDLILYVILIVSLTFKLLIFRRILLTWEYHNHFQRKIAWVVLAMLTMMLSINYIIAMEICG